MAIRLTARPLSRANIHIDESDKVHIYPVIRPSAGQVFGVDSEREERETQAQETAGWNCFWFLAGMSVGAALVACIVIVGKALWIR